jgi:non-specific serine/threonine protein kinase
VARKRDSNRHDASRQVDANTHQQGEHRRLALVQKLPAATGSGWALPAQPSALIGRDAEVAAARGLLRDGARLLTLVGPGGVGKTRLAIDLADRLQRRYPDGAGFVDLTTIRDARQVVPAIARRIGASPSGGRTSLQAVQDLLRHRHALLVLDNLEHVLDAAPRLTEILTGCPHVTLIVTSRAALDVRWEHTLPVPPLVVPDLRSLPPLASLARMPAVTLFVECARAIDRTFALTPANAPAVAELCVRLDGLPLAIELAAHQTATQSPSEILRRIGQGALAEPATDSPTATEPRMLGRGPRDLPVRHQTVEATIAWSYDLLTVPERALFRRLAVFEGGFTLSAGSWVLGVGDGGNDPPADAKRALLDRLVAHSLVVRESPNVLDEPRYRLLETIRQFAADRLVEAGETTQARDDHLAWCLEHAEAGYQRLRTGRAPEWRARLEAEHENCRAALAWCEERRDHAAFARLVAALWWYWQLHGLIGETHQYLTRALVFETGPSEVRARLLNGAAVFAYDRGEYAAAETLAAEARSLCDALGDRAGAALAQTSLGYTAHLRGQYERAAVLLDEGLALARTADDLVTAARALNNLGTVALARGDVEGARTHLDEALVLWRELQSDGATALTLLFLGQVARQQGDVPRAAELLTESVALARRSGYARAAGPALAALGPVVW